MVALGQAAARRPATCTARTRRRRGGTRTSSPSSSALNSNVCCWAFVSAGGPLSIVVSGGTLSICRRRFSERRPGAVARTVQRDAVRHARLRLEGPRAPGGSGGHSRSGVCGVWRVRPPIDEPVYAATYSGVGEPQVSSVSRPASGAVQLYQIVRRAAAGSCTGSPSSAAAPAIVPVVGVGEAGQLLRAGEAVVGRRADLHASASPAAVRDGDEVRPARERGQGQAAASGAARRRRRDRVAHERAGRAVVDRKHRLVRAAACVDLDRAARRRGPAPPGRPSPELREVGGLAILRRRGLRPRHARRIGAGERRRRPACRRWRAARSPARTRRSAPASAVDGDQVVGALGRCERQRGAVGAAPGRVGRRCDLVERTEALVVDAEHGRDGARAGLDRDRPGCRRVEAVPDRRGGGVAGARRLALLLGRERRRRRDERGARRRRSRRRGRR